MCTYRDHCIKSIIFYFILLLYESLIYLSCAFKTWKTELNGTHEFVMENEFLAETKLSV